MTPDAFLYRAPELEGKLILSSLILTARCRLPRDRVISGR
jgi:hypothetical protein